MHFLQLYWLFEQSISLYQYTNYMHIHCTKWANIPHHLTFTGWYSFHAGLCTLF